MSSISYNNQMYNPPLLEQLYDTQDPLHEEMLQMCRESGLEVIAKDSGLIKNGEIAQLKEYPSLFGTAFAQTFQSPFLPSPTHTNIPHLALQSPTQGALPPRINPQPIISPTSVAALPPPTRVMHETGQEPPKKKKRGQAANNNNNNNNTTTTTATTTTTVTTPTMIPIVQNPGTSISATTATATMLALPITTTTPVMNPVATSSLVPRSLPNAIVAKDDENKGLRHFSLKVCQKVESKRTTTYNEVADELVAEFQNSGNGAMTAVEQKNIRRRVYDVLNVLMAMNIIAKDRKEIQWIGLPTNAKLQLEELMNEYNARTERIRKKDESLKELISQRGCYRSLLARNNLPSYQSVPNSSRINLPFIVVNTRAQTVINCEVAHDRSKYFFNFSHPFEIHDDSEILRRMGLSDQSVNNNNNNNNNSSNTTTIVIAPIGSNLAGNNFVSTTTSAITPSTT
eukprot:TRINITY_DN1226_c0_g1_i4.p1 TRINITY_DN1226_c0_g1~~TRINITY_DN1226_c0_g1_i4.p1  ORF type:complete len:456 (+),score=100.76 TRINITY_DN1226_c0_g1_i4:255-1622(+)